MSGAARAFGVSRLPLSLDLRAISIEEGMRAGLSVAVLVAADRLFHAPILLESGLGALLTCLCDSGGPVWRRLPALLSFAVIGGALIAGFGLLRPIGLPLIPLACLGVFCFSLARIYGQASQQLGNLLSVVLVLSLDRSFATVHAALVFAGGFAGGSLWAVLLTMVIWRLHPNRPGRQAVARVFVAMAGLCDDARALLDGSAEPGEREWERHARVHRSAVRSAIEQARGILAERLRAGGAASRPATEGLLRLESGEGVFRALTALTDVLEADPAARPGDAADRGAAAALIGRLAAVLRAFGRHIVSESEPEQAALGSAIAGLASVARGLPAETMLRRIADLLVERARATLNLTGTIEPAAAGLGAGGLDAWLSTLRANATWQSAALRHAARAAVVAAGGFAITFTWPASYEHWLTITMILTLQPYYAPTLQRALERIGGTVLGGLIAAGLTMLCRSPPGIAAALFPLSVVALSLRGVNFGLYVTALTPMIVLLVELGAPAHGHFTVALMRALYTVIGGALAVAGCVLLWPSWEPDRLDRELRNAVARYGRYADLVLGLLQGEARQAEVDAARREAGMAGNNLEASLARAMLEPRRAGRDRLNAATVVDGALRRMGGRLSAMQIAAAPDGGEGLDRWRTWIAEMAATLRSPALPAPLPPRPEAGPDLGALADSVTRIARQWEMCAGALRRYAQEEGCGGEGCGEEKGGGQCSWPGP